MLSSVRPRSEAKGKGKQLSVATSFWSQGHLREELFNAFPGCLRNVLPVLLEKEARMPRIGPVRLLLLGMKRRRALHNRLRWRLSSG